MEMMVRAEKMRAKGSFPPKTAWFIVTDRRLVFCEKDQLGSKEHWSTPIDAIDSVVAKKGWSPGTHQLELLYRDGSGDRQKKTFEQASLSSSLMGIESRLEANRLEGLERTIVEQRQRLRAPVPLDGRGHIGAEMSAELERLAALRERGILSEVEFSAAKMKLLQL